MDKIIEIRTKNDEIGSKTLVKYKNKYFLISTVVNTYTNNKIETLVFPCDSSGFVTKYLPVAGGSFMDKKEAMADLELAMSD